jgi:transcriptional regulator with XRE-family HTH domain
MENANKNWYAMSDPAILMAVGKFLRQTRLAQNKTQQEVAAAAGINRSTMVQFEQGGGGTLLSLIQMLRALEQIELFKNFEIKQQFSPLQLAKIDQKKRQRARNKNKASIEKPKSGW